MIRPKPDDAPVTMLIFLSITSICLSRPHDRLSRGFRSQRAPSAPAPVMPPLRECRSDIHQAVSPRDSRWPAARRGQNPAAADARIEAGFCFGVQRGESIALPHSADAATLDATSCIVDTAFRIVAIARDAAGSLSVQQDARHAGQRDAGGVESVEAFQTLSTKKKDADEVKNVRLNGPVGRSPTRTPFWNCPLMSDGSSKRSSPSLPA
jgi:hypothetical protein